ncbi:NF-kappa-B inhibitor-like protein [Citrus sinensis]|nr:NF-kappa-B inhibitor-like protein [Citrus sinensis]
MEALSRISFLTNYTRSHFPIFSALPHTQKPLSKKTSPASLLRTSTRPVSEVAEEDILQMFFKDRELNGDFISKASDMFWLKGTSKFVDSDADAGKFADNSEQAHQVIESDNDDGFLKLSKTREWWLLGDNSAPINKKPSAKALQDDSERRTKLNFLKYEAAAFSYMVGVLFSCLYLQLLYQHADRLSKEMVPQIFMQKKSKKYRLKLLHLFFLPLMAALYLHYSLSSPCISKHFLFFCRIGIRSEDLKDFLERSIKGSSLAISSPRLVIPATIYGLWVLSHRYFANDLFDFQVAIKRTFIVVFSCLYKFSN